MKHPFSTTFVLLFLFFVAQIIGISLLFLNIKDISVIDGKTVVEHDTTALGDRPNLQGGGSFLFIVIGVTIGTLLLLLLIKFKLFKLWKLWFFLAVWFSMTVSFGVLLPLLLAYTLAFVLGVWKIFSPNAIIHNLTEVFIYAGIAVLIAPIFDLLWMVLLLFAISIYDMIAVWKSKHMVHMAKAQASANVFAGLYVPKKAAPRIFRKAPKKAPRMKADYAMLGGGDIAFPLLFSGVVLVWLIEKGMLPLTALYATLIITATATCALGALFWYSKKGRFYPAMPVLSFGCFVGLGIIVGIV